MDAMDNKQPLTVVYLEDTLLDVELIREILEETFQLNFYTTDNEKDFREIIERVRDFDVILSDYKMPTFNALAALEIAKEKLPLVPFICVSGTVGEEKAVELLKKGATDYILKDRLGRLVAAINRAIKEAEEQRLLQQTQDALKAQNKELLEAKEKAEESDRLKSAFLANMSHEIRTPMNGILGFSELLISSGDDEKKNHYIEIIRNSCSQLVSLVNSILDLSLIEANQTVLAKEAVDLDRIMSDQYAIFSNEARKKNIQLIRTEVPEEISHIVSDKTKLNQIISNLIGNSLKFTKDGSIEFGVERDGAYLYFYVKDTGIGIAPENQQMIFRPFRQVDERSNKLYGGTGLGLSIVKSIVEGMNGKIWVDSELGKGTTFHFVIPYQANKTMDTNRQRRLLPSKADYSGLNFLVVEDNEYNYVFIAELLKQTGVSFIHASNGQEAVDLCRDDGNKFDLIIMDILMPIKDGITATKEIKSFMNVPVLALTAYAFDSEKEAIVNSGCDSFLSKPYSKADLTSHINSLLMS